MRLISDPHTHTSYSHGKNTVAEMIAAAHAAGIREIHITEHGLAHHTARRMSMKDFYEMRAQIEEERENYPDMKILLGCEANVLSSNGDIDFTGEELDVFDVINVGFHLLVKMKTLRDFFSLLVPAVFSAKLHIRIFDRHLKKVCTRALTACLERYPIHMITHPGSYFPIDIAEVARTAAARGTYLEINNPRGCVTADDIKKLKNIPVQFIAGSDAHEAGDVGRMNKVFRIIKESGIAADRIVNVVFGEIDI